MEFGVFVQNYVPPERRAADPDVEHTVIMEDLAAVQAADQAGFKYAWIPEHHFLYEYSHLSANDVFIGYLAHATDRIHLGSGIFNPLPPVNHPAKVAERVAMLDHLTQGRFEFGTGRGAGSHEILGFLPGMNDLTHTREIWEEVIGEFPKMWLQEEYEGFQGKYWSLPPRKVLPKPWKKMHPAMWYAAGNTSSYAMAARKGLGVLGFSVGNLSDLEPVLKAYKAEIQHAEPVGAFVNDNVLVVIPAYVSEDSDGAVRAAVEGRLNHLQSQVFRYHDTFPHPDTIPYWPELIPDYTGETLSDWADAGALIVGNPDEVLAQCRRFADAGVDQLGIPLVTGTLEQKLETVRMFGEYIIPKLDTDPVHSTTRMREAAGG